MTESDSPSPPLYTLAATPDGGRASLSASPRRIHMAFSSPSSQNGLFPQSCSSSSARSHRHLLAQARAFLSSKIKHYIVLALVAMDVASIVADMFVALIACDLKQEGAEWVAETREGLHVFGTVVSSLFLVELAGMIWAFGAGFFEEWFHWLDATVIVASFAADVVMLVLHGDGIEEIAGLIIVLRLWRLIKIIEELSIGVSEGMEQMRKRVEELERENIELKRGATDQLQAHEV